ncbi:MAG: molybdenum cofactor biosynthesis protein MoaE [Blautia sp.]|nr:molybdenum cofactor biosynthesis protein MoaE [Blautia sp.]
MSEYKAPSMDEWLREAKQHENASRVGMYLTHNGVVRETARDLVRNGNQSAAAVTGMRFSYSKEKVAEILEAAYLISGIYYIRVWLNEGCLQVGDDLMYVLVGGDTRHHTINALQYLVGRIKSEAVQEEEL